MYGLLSGYGLMVVGCDVLNEQSVSCCVAEQAAKHYRICDCKEAHVRCPRFGRWFTSLPSRYRPRMIGLCLNHRLRAERRTCIQPLSKVHSCRKRPRLNLLDAGETTLRS
jgi:hypothetical protein